MWYRLAKQITAAHTSAIIALWIPKKEAKQIAMPEDKAHHADG